MTAPIMLRQADGDDLPFLRACARAAYSQYVEAIGREPPPMNADFAAHLEHDRVTIAQSSEEPMGYAVWRLDDECLFLENIAVAENARGNGIAGLMITWLEEQALQAGRTAIELYTNIKMTGNLSLYPHLGFVQTRTLIEHGFERVYFRKDLT